MTTHRRYSFVHPGSWTDQNAYATVSEVLAGAAERNWWFNEPNVSGQPFGRLAFEFTCSARDQWFCHKRAMGLAATCYRRIGLTEADVPDPVWESLEPHTNRGRYRIPKDATPTPEG